MSNRLDPHFYHPRFEKLLSVLRLNPHETLGNITKLSHHKWDPEEHQEDTFRYIEINSVSRVTGEASFSKVPVKEAPSRAQMMVRKDDIIVSLTRPHHGSIALISDDLDSCIASTGFAILREIKNPILNRTYLYSILRSQLCLSQMLQRSSGGNYPAITTDQLMRILIPTPKPNIQNHIAEIMQSAYTAKKQKDQKADALLDSIDDYVLTELGVEMPAVEEQMCFVVYANETMGRRIGVRFHHRYFLRFHEQLHNSNFPVKSLGDLTSLIYRYLNCYGFSFYDSPSDTRVPFLQVGDINATGISDENLIFIENEVSEKYPKTILKSGDLIFSVRGTIGKVAVVTHEFENSNINPNLIRLNFNERVNPQYVEIVLKSKIGQEQINRLISGGVQPTITKSDILSLEIPLPLPEIQEQIAEEALRLRSEAMKLRQEADAIVEAAKEEIVGILLAEG